MEKKLIEKDIYHNKFPVLFRKKFSGPALNGVEKVHKYEEIPALAIRRATPGNNKGKGKF